MSSKKNKSKSKRVSEGDGSVSSREDSRPHTPGHEGGRCNSLDSNSFTVIEFIDKGAMLLKEMTVLSSFGPPLNHEPFTEGSLVLLEPFLSSSHLESVVIDNLFPKHNETVIIEDLFNDRRYFLNVQCEYVSIMSMF